MCDVVWHIAVDATRPNIKKKSELFFFLVLFVSWLIFVQGITEVCGDEGTELEHIKKSRSQKMNHTPNFDVMDKNNEFNNNNSVDKSVDFFQIQSSNPSSLLKTDNKISITSTSKSIHTNLLQVSAATIIQVIISLTFFIYFFRFAKYSKNHTDA